MTWTVLLSMLVLQVVGQGDARARALGGDGGYPALERREVLSGIDGGGVRGQTAAGDAGVGPSDAGVAAPPQDGGVAALPAMAPDVKLLVDRMQSFYEKTQDFRASFRQDYFYKTFKRTQTSSGKVIYRKPALMRWNYETPSPKTFVLAGDRVLAHDPAAMLLTRSAIATNTLSASVTFLFGQGKLADEFGIERVACAKCTGVLLKLTPLRPDPRFRQVRFEVDPTTAQVLKSTVVDPDGSENAIAFLDLVTNTGVDEQTFKLAVPEGTQVQDFTKGAGATPARAQTPALAPVPSPVISKTPEQAPGQSPAAAPRP
jgi:outer membrane lipoprotein carrier protein